MANKKGFIIPRSGYRQMIIDTANKIAGNNKTLNAIADDLAYALMGGNEKYSNKPVSKNKALNNLFGNGYTKTNATNKINNTIRPNMTKGMHTAEGLAKAGKYSKSIGEGLKLAPIIGGAWDTYSGIDKIKNGHPIIGTGQTLLGLGEIGFDVAGVIAGAGTGGAGLGAETSLRTAGRAALRSAYRKALKAGATKEGALMYAKWMATPNALKQKAVQGIKGIGDFLQSKPGVILSTAGFEIPSFIMDRTSEKPTSLEEMLGGNNTEQITPINADVNKANGGSENNPNWNGGYGGYGGGYVDPGVKQDFGATGLDMNNDITKTDINDATKTASEESVIKEQQTTPGSVLANPYDVLDEWRKRQDVYDAYRNRLLNYRNNYRNLYEQTYARNKALEGMRDFGNPSAGTYTSSMSPLDLETNEVNLDKTIADEMVKPSDEYQELLGDIALANQMGLPPEVMRTDTKRFNSATDYMRAKDTAQLNNATKQYIANQNNATRLMKLQIDQEIARAKLEGDWRKVQYLGGLQVRLHEMDNAAGLQKATIGAAPWYPDTQTLLDTLDSLGYTVQRRQPQAQQVQPVNQQTVRANASIQATPGNKDSNLGRAFGQYSGR